MTNELVAVAVISGVASLGALGMAAKHTVQQTKLQVDGIGNALRKAYDEAAAEPIPDDIAATLNSLRESGL